MAEGQPDEAPLAEGSQIGDRSPARYGRKRSPSAPGGTAAASASRSSVGAGDRRTSSRSQSRPGRSPPSPRRGTTGRRSVPGPIDAGDRTARPRHRPRTRRASARVDRVALARAARRRRSSAWASAIPATTGTPGSSPSLHAGPASSGPRTVADPTRVGSGRPPTRSARSPRGRGGPARAGSSRPRPRTAGARPPCSELLRDGQRVEFTKTKTPPRVLARRTVRPLLEHS